jgi:low affinity Fe/Cu permease
MKQRTRGSTVVSANDHSDRPAPRSVRDSFNRAADVTTNALGSMPALVASVLVVSVWAVTGPFFHFSDTWQLFINTTTTVITFFMVFVIQSSANRATKATQLKLDELIRAVQEARNEFIVVDREPEAVMAERENELVAVAEEGTNASGERPAAARPRRAIRSGGEPGRAPGRPAASSRPSAAASRSTTP